MEWNANVLTDIKKRLLVEKVIISAIVSFGVWIGVARSRHECGNDNDVNEAMSLCMIKYVSWVNAQGVQMLEWTPVYGA